MESSNPEQRECILCGSGAVRFQPNDDVNVFVWQCPTCGTWRAGLAREMMLARLPVAARKGLSAQVTAATRDGRVLLL